MAKKQEKTSKSSKGPGKQNAINLGSVTKNIENTERGRSRNRNQHHEREQRRDSEREEGTFHLRVNAGRSTDLAAILRGEIGDYAIPGGNQPSVHLNVQKEIRRQDAVMVVRFESIQEGHPLSGSVFNPNIFVPCFYIQKFGVGYKSRSEDRLAAATQELICHYLATEVETAMVPSFKRLGETQDTQDMFPDALEDLRPLLDEIEGLYCVRKDEGLAVFEVFTAKKVGVKVVYSTLSELTESRTYIPVYLLNQETLNQVTSNEMYAQQCAIHTFLRKELREELEALKNKPKSKKQERRENVREARAIERDTEAANEVATLVTLRKQCIPVSSAALGATGHVEMSNASGELIVMFGKDGADHVAQVAFIGKQHMLRLAGVDVGTRVFAGQILNGRVDRFDYGVDKMKKEEIAAKTALINYIRDKFEDAGIKMKPRKPANLKLAA